MQKDNDIDGKNGSPAGKGTVAPSPESQPHDTEPHEKDWEKVFEDPKVGLIALISRVPSKEFLHECIDFTIDQLFPGEEDAAHRQEFMDRIESFYGEHDTDWNLEDIREAIIALLREIKKERLQAQKSSHEEVPLAEDASDEAGAARRRARRGAVSHHKEPAPRLSTRLARALGVDRHRLNMIMVLITTTVLAVIALAVYIINLPPSLSAEDQAKIIAWLDSYGNEVRPSQAWLVEPIHIDEKGRFVLPFQMRAQQHIRIIKASSSMDRQNFVTSLCPPKTNEMMQLVERHRKVIWIALKDGGTLLTGASCQ